jgi:hypothetical protein
MVGIHKKITQLLKLVQKYAPILNNVIPGLGNIVGTVGKIGEHVADGVNNVYNDYQSAKKAKQKYGVLDGIKSFVSISAKEPLPTKQLLPDKRPLPAMNSLTKSYGELHPRLKLKDKT